MLSTERFADTRPLMNQTDGVVLMSSSLAIIVHHTYTPCGKDHNSSSGLFSYFNVPLNIME